jgi:DNA mismatch endonuclease (patch repair protein)
MARIRSSDTTPELIVRRAIWSIGIGYRLHRRDLPGRPDIAMIGRRMAIFVHGCFWHGHDCKRGARVPQTNRDYWVAKIERNRVRDAAALAALAEAGWTTVVIWECETRDPVALRARLEALLHPSCSPAAFC